MTTPTAAAEAAAAPGRPRPTIGRLRQTARLTRTEFTLFVRYKTAWMFLALPMFLLVVSLGMESYEVFPGVDSTAMSMAGMLGSIGLIVGLGHASNVFTARREALVLKRLRVSGVPQSAIFGAVIGVVALFSLLVAVLMTAVTSAFTGSMPQDPVMLLVAVLLSTVPMTLLGLLVTPMVRNAEAAQMAAMVPMMILLFLGGLFIPLGMLPDPLREAMMLLPVAPVTLMAQAAFTGYDVFGGLEAATQPGYLGLWAAALPSICVVLAWTAVLALLVRRFFKWDPRQP
ncbi:ABC transporter permease [Nocardiopsis tropica]|jgi:ABC-2 type transport system permease protein|uniref:ABC transporter permease n=1 Tax=Nocardiopsis tropica TaxID=109330 RepID=A0ABU7KV02_9ACTN|nr:ABC transporter permease [Nocardiopsis umidischolae]MEE2053120.1 ABC transporter permease [Nocardiopsis umidischolae]